ncbi:flavodoxin family protein [Methanofollis formosanus]|uniref:Flavodoxin family protein n=1 Tax=Methanofollis formosanus TaxID=299308 RepID=A0A8G1EG72_9EURY|nr:flavodoxin family protein [Methanofollis formosanus]QYZ78617.1 flavodoxin family protein [Methanofollis formosanus]
MPPHNPHGILGVGGSPRRGGNTDILLDRILEGAAAGGAEVEGVHLRDYTLEACTGCERCRRDLTCTRFLDGMHLLYPKLEGAGGLVIGSPTYNYNVTSMTKSFIDRLYPYYIFTKERPGVYSSRLAGEGRRALVFSVSEQAEIGEQGFTLEALSMPLEALGYQVVERFPVTGIFERGAVKGHDEIMDAAYELGRRFGRGMAAR